MGKRSARDGEFERAWDAMGPLSLYMYINQREAFVHIGSSQAWWAKILMPF
jgi:hypothetical protein